MKANQRARDEAVTDVLGNILMVGITVTMMVGLSLLILNIEGPIDKTHVDLATRLQPGGLAWNEGDEAVVLEHRGGEPIIRKHVTLTIRIDGNANTFSGDLLDGDFADGTLSVGESWTFTTTIPADAEIQVVLANIQSNSLVTANRLIASTALASATPPVSTFVDSETVTTSNGDPTDFANAQSATDSNAVASYTEDSAPGGSSTRQLSGTVSNSNGALNPDRVESDDGDRATFDDVSDFVEVSGYDVPVAALALTDLYIGFEAQRANGGPADPTIRITYSGGPGLPTSQVFSIDPAETEYKHRVWTDGLWTIPLVEAMTVRVEMLTDSGKDVLVDHVYVEATYNEVPATTLDFQYDWTGVPDRPTQQLQIRYRTVGDTFSIEASNGAGGWNPKGTLAYEQTPPQLTLFTVSLSPSEYNSGAPSIRIRDLDTGAPAGTLYIEYARVQSV